MTHNQQEPKLIQIQDDVAEYYNRNTQRFLRLGGSGQAAAIHRQIWAPQVEDSEQAFLYLNQVVAEAIAPALTPNPAKCHLLDLGCGAGGTATWLAQQLGVGVTGVTNSPVQAEIAKKRADKLGLTERQCRFLVGDFHDLPEVGRFDGIYAIEAFVHARDPRLLFSQLAGRVKEGGRLVICDDFLLEQSKVGKDSAQAQKWLKRFKQGWHVYNLLTPQEANRLAQEAGFWLVDIQDLSPYLSSFSPLVLRLLGWATRLPLPFAYWQNLSGGTALQVCQREGWCGYYAMTWERAHT